MNPELLFIAPMLIGALLMGLLMIGAAGGFDDVVERRRSKRRNMVTISETRQRELQSFWIEEQCRINPNMIHLLSGARFEKKWQLELEISLEKLEPMTKRERKQWTLMFMENPRMRPEKMTWK